LRPTKNYYQYLQLEIYARAYTAGRNLISKHGTRVLTTATVDSRASAVGIPRRRSPFYRRRAVERVPLLASTDLSEDPALLAIGTVERVDGRLSGQMRGFESRASEKSVPEDWEI